MSLIPAVYTLTKGRIKTYAAEKAIVATREISVSYFVKLAFSSSISFFAIISPKFASIPAEKEEMIFCKFVMIIL